ncbi:MAG: carboxypeptidase regulatory-like domain-containing protein [Acidobacteriota bacterium]
MPRPCPRSAYCFAIAVALACSTLPAGGQPTAISGTLTLVENGSDKSDKEVRHALVWFEPHSTERPRPKPTPPAEPYQIAMVRKAFQPRVLAVPVGSEVAFPNGDAILHNVFSLDRSNRFDLGLYRRGESKSVTFDAAGIVEVFCNVHHSMVAHVVVLDTPFFARVGADGRFRLDGLPPGPGRLHAWHERSDPLGVDVVVPADGSIDLRLEITKPKVPPHRNKFGKPYSRKRRGKAY